MNKSTFLSFVLLMVAAIAMAQPKSGLYKQTKFLSAEGQEQGTPQDVYLLLKNGKTYEMQTYDVDGVERVYVVEKDMKALKSVDDDLHYTWTYDPSGYPGGQNTVEVTNIYSPAKRIMSETIKTFFDLMERVDKKGSKKNLLLGVWHEANTSSTSYYKFYDRKMRMTLHIAKVGNSQSMIFTLESVEYTPDGNTKEGGNPCQISWENNNLHKLSYQYNGHTNTEKWSRTALPAYVVEIFK